MKNKLNKKLMTDCRVCNEQVSTSAETCPDCKAHKPGKKKIPFGWVPCKACGKEMNQSKACAHCGHKEKGGCLILLVLLAAFVIWGMSGDKDEVFNRSLEVNDANINLDLFSGTKPLEYTIESEDCGGFGCNVIVTVPKAKTAKERVATAISVAKEYNRYRDRHGELIEWVTVNVVPAFFNDDVIHNALEAEGVEWSYENKESFVSNIPSLSIVGARRYQNGGWQINNVNYATFVDVDKLEVLEFTRERWQTMYIASLAIANFQHQLNSLDAMHVDRVVEHQREALNIDGKNGNDNVIFWTQFHNGGEDLWLLK